MSRTATVTRKTRETNITVTLDLDGSGKADLHTGIGFFDHMLDGFARHGLFDLTLHCDGDLNVDCHHTIEDCGIALGTAIREALGDKAGIVRYGSCMPWTKRWPCALWTLADGRILFMMPVLPGRAAAAWMCRWHGNSFTLSATAP